MTQNTGTILAFLSGDSESAPERVTIGALLLEAASIRGDITETEAKLDGLKVGIGRLAFAFVLAKRITGNTSVSNLLAQFEETCEGFPASEKTFVKRAVNVHENACRTMVEGSSTDMESVLPQVIAYVRQQPGPRKIYDDHRKAAKAEQSAKSNKGKARAVITGETEAELQVIQQTDTAQIVEGAQALIRELVKRAESGSDPLAMAEIKGLKTRLTAKVGKWDEVKEAIAA